VLLFVSVLTAQAKYPITGLRMNICTGAGLQADYYVPIASHCPYAQLGLAYSTERISVDAGLGIGPVLILGHAGIQMYPLDNKEHRFFVGLHAGTLNTIIFGADYALGGSLGYDFYLDSSRGFFVLTPRFGADWVKEVFTFGFSSSETNSSSLSTSLELGYVF